MLHYGTQCGTNGGFGVVLSEECKVLVKNILDEMSSKLERVTKDERNEDKDIPQFRDNSGRIQEEYI